MYSLSTVILALLFAVVMIFLSYTAVQLRRRTKECTVIADRRLGEKKSTEFLDKRKFDDTCDICFGEFEEDRVAVCKCGMKFHEECASLTEECPYCKAGFDTMHIRDIVRPACPWCGTIVEKNICPSCGTVLPNRDMGFECACGNTVYGNEGYCKECGSVYEFTYDGPKKRK